jgi:hypothetical protein
MLLSQPLFVEEVSIRLEGGKDGRIQKARRQRQKAEEA